MFQTKKVVEKIKTHIFCSITSFRKSCCLGDSAEKYCRDGQNTDGNVARRMHIASWITNGTDTHTHTHSEYELPIAVPR